MERLHPSYKLLSQALPNASSYLVAVEFPTDPLRGWASAVGAASLKTVSTMTDDRSARARAIYKEIEFNGNNSWADRPGKRDALTGLRSLQALGELDKELILAHTLSRNSFIAVGLLEKLIDEIVKAGKLAGDGL